MRDYGHSLVLVSTPRRIRAFRCHARRFQTFPHIFNKGELVSRNLFIVLLCLTVASPLFGQVGSVPFRVEEASITDIQSAIRGGRTTCKQVVQAYLDRTKAYNGVCTALLTKDGKPIPPSTGMARAGAPIQYPTETVAASTVFPNLDQYKGLPL